MTWIWWFCTKLQIGSFVSFRNFWKKYRFNFVSLLKFSFHSSLVLTESNTCTPNILWKNYFHLSNFNCSYMLPTIKKTLWNHQINRIISLMTFLSTNKPLPATFSYPETLCTSVNSPKNTTRSGALPDFVSFLVLDSVNLKFDGWLLQVMKFINKIWPYSSFHVQA
jgi:hypothetical protein